MTKEITIPLIIDMITLPLIMDKITKMLIVVTSNMMPRGEYKDKYVALVLYSD